LRVPTSSNGTTFGPGSANNLLKSNGTSVYWTTLVASDIPSLSTDKLTSGTLGVARGGTGAASFTANSVIISGSTTTAALTTRAIYNRTSKGNLEWTANATDTHIITKNTLAYWDGSYSGTSSNLTYCVKGVFGDAVTYGVDDTTANGALGTGTGLTTERSVYYGLVTVNNASQTRATGIYAPTSAGTANQILVSAGGTSAPTWKATANGAAYTTSVNGALTFGTLPVAQGGTGATTAADARTNLGLGSIATYGAATAGTTDTWGLVPVIGASDGVMEVGKYIDFHTTDKNTANYDVRIQAATSGLTISGTTTGTFSGNLTGNATTATKATQDADGNTISSTYLKKSGDTMTGDLNIRKNSAWTLSLSSDLDSGMHGLKSSGYGRNDDGLVWTGDETWLVYRDANGNVILNGNAYSATKATQDADGNTISSTYLKLSGGTMTGKLTFNKVQNAIAYTGTNASHDMIKFIDNTGDGNGDGISIGGGGATIIGGGESTNEAVAQVAGGNEVLYLCNDSDVNIFTNMQDGWGSRKTFTFGSNGTLTAPAFSGPLTGNVTGNCSGSSGSCASDNLTNIAFTWSGSYSTGSWMLIYNNETGTNGGVLFRAINRANTAAWVDNEHKWARIEGDTFTGSVYSSGAGERAFAATNTDTNCRIYLDSDSKASGGNHGIYSSGYWNGSSYVKNGKWMIVRGQGGNITVNGNCTGTASNVTGTVAVGNGGTGATNAIDARANLQVPQTSTGSNDGQVAYFTFKGRNGHWYDLIIYTGASYKIGLHDQTNGMTWRI